MTLVKLLFASEESLDAQNNDKKPSRKTQLNVDRNEIRPIGQKKTSQWESRTFDPPRKYVSGKQHVFQKNDSKSFHETSETLP